MGRHRLHEAAGVGVPGGVEDGIDRAVDLDWWQEVAIGPNVRVIAVPVQHGSMRGTCDRDATLWAGYVITGPSGRVMFAGDTGYGPHFQEIGRRLGPFRAALLPIGAFKPESVLAPVHMSPAGAVRAHHDLGALGEPIHDLALAFVAPLSADENRVCHKIKLLSRNKNPRTRVRGKVLVSLPGEARKVRQCGQAGTPGATVRFSTHKLPA